MDRRQWLVRMLLLLTPFARPQDLAARGRRAWRTSDAGQVGIVRWMWAGSVSATSATVVAKVTSASGSVRLRVQPDDGTPDVIVSAAPAGAPELFRFVVNDLRPATTYSYHLLHDETAWSIKGRFRTPATRPHNAVILFGSCASTGSNAAIWETMRAVNADLLIHLGDLHYRNVTRDEPARFYDAFDRCLTSSRQGALYRSLPLAYVWDDHDFGPDDSNRHSPSARAAHRAYREYVPHYPLTGGPTDTIQQAFSIGRVRIIVTDARSARDAEADRTANTRSMLGAAQRQWLLDELEAASRTAALVVWANPVPWITKNDERTHHGWARFHEERALIAGHIERLGLTTRLLMVSGDAHMVAIDDGTNSQYAPDVPADRRGFVVVQAGAFDRFGSRKGGPYSHGARAGRGQFGEVRIDDTGERLVATVTCRDSRGRQIRNLSIRMTCANGTCHVDGGSA